MKCFLFLLQCIYSTRNESEVNELCIQSEEVEIDTEVLEEKSVHDDEVLESETEDQYEAHKRVVIG